MPNTKAIWTPNQRMANVEDHTAEIIGTALDPSGLTRSVNFTNWGFKTANNVGLLYQSDFQSRPTNTPFTNVDADIVFKSQINRKNFDSGWTFNRQDPKGVRGNVLMIELPQGDQSRKVAATCDYGPPIPEIWVSYDVLFGKGYLFGSGMKMPMGAESNNLYGRTSNGGWSFSRFMCHGNPSLPAGPACWSQGDAVTKFGYLPRDEGVFTSYYSYMADPNGNAHTTLTRPMNKNNPFTRINTTAQVADNWLIPDDTWITLTQHYKMNDVSTNTSGPNGGASYASMDNPTYKGTGVMDFYVNGQLMWGHQNGVIIRNKTDVLWQLATMVHFYGGNNPDWNSPTCGTQRLYLDNIRVSSAPLL